MTSLQAQIDHYKEEIAGIQEEEKQSRARRDEESQGGDSLDADDDDEPRNTYIEAHIDEHYDDLDDAMQTTIADVFELSASLPKADDLKRWLSNAQANSRISITLALSRLSRSTM